MKYKSIYFIVSALFIIPGVVSLFLYGLKPDIDFTGGTLYEIRFNGSEKILLEDLDKAITTSKVGVWELGDNNFLIKLNFLDEEEKNKLGTTLQNEFGEFEELRFETVGPSLGKELLEKTLIAVVLASLLIMFYVSMRFKDKIFGISAIVAMFHDSLLLIGTFSLLGHFFGVEVDSLFVTAVLTILSFSVHDTIVVYDRIRESMNRKREQNFVKVVNNAVNETLTRSLNNSLTIIFMLTALFLMGGESIRWFILALLIGTISGTYSSTFTAAPLLIVMKKAGNLVSVAKAEGRKQR